MYKKDLGRFIAGALIIFLVVGAIGFFCVRALNHEVSRTVKDTLPGLIYAGAANNIMEDNFIRSMGLAELQSAEERGRYLKQIEQVSKQTEAYMEKYRQSIYESEDRKNFQRLVQTRNEYVRLREQFFELIRLDKREEASKFFKAVVTPAYNQYNAAGEAMFDYNVKMGEKQGEKIMALSYATPVLVGVFGVVIFILGALVGLKATLP
jgi:hypothetical protein